MSARITCIEAFPINYPVAGHFKFFEGVSGRPPGRPAVVVKITTDSGVGWGESVPSHRWSYETLESVYTTIKNYLGPALIGADAFDSDGIQAILNRTIAASFSTGQPICKAGIDLALWDLTGKLRGQSLREQWGRQGRDRITLSWTLNPRTLDEIEPLNGPQFLTSSILESSLNVVSGQLTVPEGPGLAVPVDEEQLKAHLIEGLD